MPHSPLVDTERAAPVPAGRDTQSLGPSDSSDSGADLAGVDRMDTEDPSMPVDQLLDEDRQHPIGGGDPADPGADSDAAGTGERASAGNDAGDEAADILPDRVIDADAGTDAESLDDVELRDLVVAEEDETLGDEDADADDAEAAGETGGTPQAPGR